jgi:hypothetical protein
MQAAKATETRLSRTAGGVPAGFVALLAAEEAAGTGVATRDGVGP